MRHDQQPRMMFFGLYRIFQDVKVRRKILKKVSLKNTDEFNRSMKKMLAPPGFDPDTNGFPDHSFY